MLQERCRLGVLIVVLFGAFTVSVASFADEARPQEEPAFSFPGFVAALNGWIVDLADSVHAWTWSAAEEAQPHVDVAAPVVGAHAINGNPDPFGLKESSPKQEPPVLPEKDPETTEDIGGNPDPWG